MVGDAEAEQERQVAVVLSEEDLAPRLAAYELIFKDHSSQKLKESSLKERKEKDMEQQQIRNLSYSEIDIANLNSLLNQIKETPGQYGNLYVGDGTFLDLGSGAGKACLATALLHPFKKVVGIEFLDCLGDAASGSQEKFGNAEFLSQLETPLPEGMVKPELEFIKGNFVTDFDDKLAPLAADLKVCFANATCFGEEQLQAMTKLANLMPDGSLFITLTQRLPESLILDLDRDPKQRHAAAVKKRLAKPGTEPQGVEILPAPAKNDPNGWRQVCSQQIDLEWGTTTLYIFRKRCFPYCEPGDLCLACPLPKKKEGDGAKEPPADGGDEAANKEPKIKEEDLQYFLTIYKGVVEVPTEGDGKEKVTQGIFLDDASETVRDLLRVQPLTVQRLRMYSDRYREVLNSVREAAKKDAVMQALGAWAKLEGEMPLDGEGRPQDSLQYNSAKPGPEGKIPLDGKIIPAPEVLKLGEQLLANLEAVKDEPWAMKYMAMQLPEVCREQDAEGTGFVSKNIVGNIWEAMRAKFVATVEARSQTIEEHQFP